MVETPTRTTIHKHFSSVIFKTLTSIVERYLTSDDYQPLNTISQILRTFFPMPQGLLSTECVKLFCKFCFLTPKHERMSGVSSSTSVME